jgi:hypothetical protein
MAKIIYFMKGLTGGTTALRMALGGTLPTWEVIDANLNGLSYAKVVKAEQLTEFTPETPYTAETAPSGMGIAAKALIVCRDSTGDIQRFTIPSPKLNVAGGINCLTTDNGRDFIPAVAVGTGLGGDTLASMLENLTAQEGLVFLSGSIVRYNRA